MGTATGTRGYPKTRFQLIDQTYIPELPVETVNNQAIIMVAYTSDKGSEGWQMIRGLSNFTKTKGGINYEKHGQAQLTIAQVLRSGGLIFGKRMVSDDATLANATIRVRVVQSDDVSYVYTYMTAATGAQNLREAAQSGGANFDYNDEDATDFPLFTIAAAGRGGSSIYFRIVPEYSNSRSTTVLRYTCEVYEDGELLDRLAFLAVNFLDNHLRLAHLQLVALATHGLDKDAEVHNATAVDEEGVGRAGLLDAHGQVLLQLGEEAVAQVAAGDILALLAEEGRGVDSEEHTHGRLIDLDGRQRLGGIGIADGVANLKGHILVQVHQHSTYLTGLHRGLDTFLAESLESIELFDFTIDTGAVALHEGDILSGLERTAMQTTHGNTAKIGTVVETRYHHLCVAVVGLRLRYILDDEVHQITDILGGSVPILAHPALLGRTVGGGELQLVVVGAEVEHEVEDSLLRQLGVTVGLVHLVDHHDGLQTQLYGFLQHEAGLWHRPFEGIDHQQHTVGHVEHALHFAAKVAVARGVDDIDFITFIPDTHILAEDGDTAFALEVVVVEDELAGLLIVTKQLGLMKHAVDQGGLAMVDVGYNSNITNILHI